MPPVPSFNTWTIVFLIAAVQGYFIAFVLFRWRRGNRQANRILASLLLLFAITLSEYVLYWTNYLFRFVHAADLSAQFPFLFGPLVWLYLRSIYEQKALKWQDGLHFIPFLAAVLAYMPWYTMSGVEKTAAMLGKGPFPFSKETYQIILWGRIAFMVGYAAWNFRYIRRQPRVAATTRWAVTLNAFFSGFVLAYISYFILARFPFFNLSRDYHISAAMTAFIYLIAYSGYTQQSVFEGYQWLEPSAPVKYRNSGLTPEASRSLLQHLNSLMFEEKYYHDPEISLEKLANALNAGKHHVSQVINEHLGASFFEYVNQLRVEEAKQLLAETTRSDLHVIEVAYTVGFNNKVSFNTAFKKATGMTPTEFRRNHAKSDGTEERPGAVGSA
ncbi:MAG: AraC family transcriptional regulator [Lewinellaceae bacterium]|nr:AraC family transcriptional regulator [Lewinellaceae bacterium]